MRKILSVLIGVVTICHFHSLALSWDNEKTHQDLSEVASYKSIIGTTNYLKNIGLEEGLLHLLKLGAKQQEIYKWLREGAFLEDAGNIVDLGLGRARSYNHFHNPLKQWDSAGLNDYYIVTNPYPPFIPITYSMSGESALLWAQDQEYQKKYYKLEGDQTWQTIRNNYYKALTGKTDADRQAYFARTFKGFGHQMHLIQDMSVPAHVRNDAHVGEGVQDWLVKKNVPTGDLYFETWAKKYYPIINTFASTPLFPQVDLTKNPGGKVPITQFYDTDQYTENFVPNTGLTWGLSEYTNANFVSDDTIFTENFSKNDGHYFPYPRYTDQNQCYEQFDETYIATNKKRTYWRKKCVGEAVEHFVTAGPLFKYLPIWDLQRLTLKLDEATHNDYADKLVRRAVGYSAGLLNYFFRGDISLRYEADANAGYVIVNNTNENMNGTFRIFYDNVRDERIELWSKPLVLNASSKSVKIDFPIPNNAKEPGKYILVFRGRLGNEEGAVVGHISGRFLEITPPDQYVYSLIDAGQSPQHFTNIKAKVRNASPDEGMRNGTIKAVAKYKISTTQEDFTYSSSTPISISSLSSDAPSEFEFDFTNEPIPISISDLSLEVRFTGKVGDEDNAVAIGIRDISEPTPIDVFNNMDRICINESWYVAGSSEAIAQVDTDHNGIANEWDVYPHDLKDIYLKISSVNDLNNASPADYNLYVPYIKAGEFYRAYVLSDYRLNHSDYVTAVPIVQDDKNNWNHTKAIMKGNWEGFAVKDQEEYHSEEEICAQFDIEAPCIIVYSPDFYSFRGKEIWGAGGVILDNPEYPPDSKCSWEDL